MIEWVPSYGSSMIPVLPCRTAQRGGSILTEINRECECSPPGSLEPQRFKQVSGNLYSHIFSIYCVIKIKWRLHPNNLLVPPVPYPGMLSFGIQIYNPNLRSEDTSCVLRMIQGFSYGLTFFNWLHLPWFDGLKRVRDRRTRRKCTHFSIRCKVLIPRDNSYWGFEDSQDFSHQISKQKTKNHF